MDNVQCTGSEKELMNCAANFSDSCTHTQDVGVKCVIGKFKVGVNKPPDRTMQEVSQQASKNAVAPMPIMIISVHFRTNILIEVQANYLTYIIGCTEGDVRLLEGATRLEGRVEICKNNLWSTVCDNGWISVDARVVCRQLGYSAVGNSIQLLRDIIPIVCIIHRTCSYCFSLLWARNWNNSIE